MLFACFDFPPTHARDIGMCESGGERTILDFERRPKSLEQDTCYTWLDGTCLTRTPPRTREGGCSSSPVQVLRGVRIPSPAPFRQYRSPIRAKTVVRGLRDSFAECFSHVREELEPLDGRPEFDGSSSCIALQKLGRQIFLDNFKPFADYASLSFSHT